MLLLVGIGLQVPAHASPPLAAIKWCACTTNYVLLRDCPNPPRAYPNWSKGPRML